MNTLEVILAVTTIISFLIALYSLVKAEVRKAHEEANIEILKERLRAVHQALTALYHTADSIVQIPKRRDGVRIEELQDIARVLRGQIVSHATIIKESRATLGEWRYGQLIKSNEPVSDRSSEEPPSQNSEVSIVK